MIHLLQRDISAYSLFSSSSLFALARTLSLGQTSTATSGLAGAQGLLPTAATAAPAKTTIVDYYLSRHCLLCHALTHQVLCAACKQRPQAAYFLLVSRMRLLEVRTMRDAVPSLLSLTAVLLFCFVLRLCLESHLVCATDATLSSARGVRAVRRLQAGGTLL